MKNLDFSYMNPSGKRVVGAAAFTHHVYTEAGGVQAYNDEIGAAYVNEFVRQNSDIINAGIEAQARRSRLKVI